MLHLMAYFVLCPISGTQSAPALEQGFGLCPLSNEPAEAGLPKGNSLLGKSQPLYIAQSVRTALALLGRGRQLL